jgi:hypothetical protein
MTLLGSLAHPSRPLVALRRRPRTAVSAAPVDTAEQPTSGTRVFAVQQLGAVGVGLFLLPFGLLGAAGGVGFLSTSGERYLGLSSNGLLSALSLMVAAVLLGAAARGPRTASTVMIVLGGLFLLSALVNLALLRTSFNLLALRMSNVVFSIGVGLLLLCLGAYGRISGHLPEDSPYAHPHAAVVEPPYLVTDPDDLAAEAAMREAEVAVVQHYATEEQVRRVRAMAQVRTPEERRRVWRDHDAAA